MGADRHAGARANQMWLGAGAAVLAVLLVFGLLASADDDSVQADATHEVTSTTADATSTTRERRTTTTTIATTTTGAPESDVEPDPTAPASGVGTDPGRTGGLSSAGSGTVDVDALLARVDVRPESSADSYDRSLFGSWIDADGDGCDTRAEVLRAESSTPAQVDPYGCHVLAGDWLSIYDGYTTDDPTELEIDHVVALAEAWRSGAAAWSPQRRVAYANDLDHPGSLAAVTAATNRSKSDRDPSSWQPPNRSAWCLYAVDWLNVKDRWDLSMDQAEATALRNMLNSCGSGSSTPPPPPPPPPPPTTAAPAPQPPGGCDAAYPGVCIPPAPPDLDCGDISYRRFQVLPPDPHRFDGEGDGLGCES